MTNTFEPKIQAGKRANMAVESAEGEKLEGGENDNFFTTVEKKICRLSTG